jgi:hypothetical protein
MILNYRMNVKFAVFTLKSSSDYDWSVKLCMIFYKIVHLWSYRQQQKCVRCNHRREHRNQSNCNLTNLCLNRKLLLSFYYFFNSYGRVKKYSWNIPARISGWKLFRIRFKISKLVRHRQEDHDWHIQMQDPIVKQKLLQLHHCTLWVTISTLSFLEKSKRFCIRQHSVKSSINYIQHTLCMCNEPLISM